MSERARKIIRSGPSGNPVGRPACTIRNGASQARFFNTYLGPPYPPSGGKQFHSEVVPMCWIKSITLSIPALALSAALTAQAQPFALQANLDADGSFGGSIAVGDFNNDGLADFLSSGQPVAETGHAPYVLDWAN